MRIGEPARRHGIADHDMLHAVRNAIREFNVDEVTMLIGPARNGALLEIGVLDLDDDTAPTIIHAMALRPKFHRLI